jgi:hypothetical protein
MIYKIEERIAGRVPHNQRACNTMIPVKTFFHGKKMWVAVNGKILFRLSKSFSIWQVTSKLLPFSTSGSFRSFFGAI